MDLLKIIWKKWLKIGLAIGNFQSQVILTIFYIIILMPIALVYSFTLDELKIRKINKLKSSFKKWQYNKEDINSARHQY